MLMLQLRRLVYRHRVKGTALQHCWQTPLPSTSKDWRQVSFLVVDAEMSSLDPATGELLSVGWVVIDDGAIRLDTARHFLIKAEQSVGQSATIHNIRDCEIEDAPAPAAVLSKFLKAAAGRFLVFHNASLDIAFLNRVSRSEFNVPVLLPAVDTLLQEEALMRRAEQPIQAGDLRLQACRDRYNLPHLPAHNALQDALATAELLLAQAGHRASGQSFPVKNLL